MKPEDIAHKIMTEIVADISNVTLTHRDFYTKNYLNTLDRVLLWKGFDILGPYEWLYHACPMTEVKDLEEFEAKSFKGACVEVIGDWYLLKIK